MTSSYEKPEGLTESELREFEDMVERSEKAIRNRVCPECESPLTKTLTEGLWFHYECGCGFFVDQQEFN